MQVKQFSDSSLSSFEDGRNKPCWFECSMISSCRPVFDDFDSNYDVEMVLRKAHVIRADNQTDTESCALVVNFSSRKVGENFLRRLNKYLVKQSEK